MSPIVLVLLAFLSTGLSVSPRLHRSKAMSVLQSQTSQEVQVQAAPDVACTNWLQSPAGVAFTDCQNVTDNIPSRNSKNNCTVNPTDYDMFCNNTCYNILMSGYEYILTGPCLAFFEELWAPCGNDTDCGDGSLCYQGNCYASCKSNDDCNGCVEQCNVFPQRNDSGCQNTVTIPSPNTTMSFRGTVYSLNSYCAKNPAGDYCSVLANSNVLYQNLSMLQCSQLASWDCCLGTILQTDQYCQFRTFNNSGIYQCLNSNNVCSPLPSAQDFCSNTTIPIVNNTSPIVNNTNGTSSITIGLPGSSSVTVIVNPNGTLGTGNNGNGAGKDTAPWLLVLGLMCTLLFSS